MKAHEAEKLIAVIRELAHDGPEDRKRPELDRPYQKMSADQKAEIAKIGAAAATGDPNPSTAAVDFEVLYQKIKRRLLDELRTDPTFVKLLATQGEILIEIEPKVVELDGSTVRGRTARLIAAGWFATPRVTFAVRKELTRTGSDPGGGGALAGVLGDFVRDGLLVREGDGYQVAPGIKISEKVIEAR